VDVCTGAQDIGTWQVILQYTSFAAVITNGAIMCFTMDLLPFTLAGRIWTFIGFQYVLFFGMEMFSSVVDDVPVAVQIQLDRRDHLRDLVHLFTQYMVMIRIFTMLYAC
jgi:uncharacterized membrane protein YcgQ (UPF0703/DUF1980 family)